MGVTDCVSSGKESCLLEKLNFYCRVVFIQPLTLNAISFVQA